LKRKKSTGGLFLGADQPSEPEEEEEEAQEEDEGPLVAAPGNDGATPGVLGVFFGRPTEEEEEEKEKEKKKGRREQESQSEQTS